MIPLEVVYLFNYSHFELWNLSDRSPLAEIPNQKSQRFQSGEYAARL